MVYANQQEYYKAIAKSTAEGQSGLFVDFMLGEILKTLKNNILFEVPNKSELRVLRLLTENPHMTRVELAQNIGISESSVKKILAKMKASAWIERKGSNKKGYWLVNKTL